ncbi:bifunctional adenosylcobinamide kinase/adenosylcobinamide-phosphate guanylyltransferase [Pseudomonas neustonica]|uniref:Bifunctional adenosylcobalamin biosynthesis protein n=1 Tax=Pseudomonas neustonica TaxID=2487346 RepID=A0ABX9XJA2_9PSED|nr:MULTISPECIES: bifunctional adenosylcobinamide kinase/adenosylcobinamide-phosphate guanylyltransferase [Pseudomonas]ROZ83907.1 bifunctional adenosylcobinamide kinase/adenosylcobinamide-phosphate guanylyltransferase [Pseudomonas sp. SSM44]ROZ85866.1 bifunctional adenosylcobinamide kinase/adenosylcobinamide-phosphate guanylyltransferase [Pseudomonas neustonica]|tara:strand:- start:14091 stop:14612 length:522 start_codon:yes stop_codon:yes gene_type:complete
MHELILGGARSGKSRLAERLAAECGLPVTYIATCQPRDQEMRDRVVQHRAQRPADWALVEEPTSLAQVLREHAATDRCLLVDCLTLWVSNLLLSPDEQDWTRERQALFDCLPELPGRIIMVSNETGLGVVPMGELSRRFVDESGWLHQQLAEHCDRVVFCIAGLPQTLKGEKL